MSSTTTTTTTTTTPVVHSGATNSLQELTLQDLRGLDFFIFDSLLRPSQAITLINQLLNRGANVISSITSLSDYPLNRLDKFHFIIPSLCHVDQSLKKKGRKEAVQIATGNAQSWKTLSTFGMTFNVDKLRSTQWVHSNFEWKNVLESKNGIPDRQDVLTTKALERLERIEKQRKFVIDHARVYDWDKDGSSIGSWQEDLKRVVNDGKTEIQPGFTAFLRSRDDQLYQTIPQLKIRGHSFSGKESNNERKYLVPKIESGSISSRKKRSEPFGSKGVKRGISVDSEQAEERRGQKVDKDDDSSIKENKRRKMNDRHDDYLDGFKRKSNLSNEKEHSIDFQENQSDHTMEERQTSHQDTTRTKIKTREYENIHPVQGESWEYESMHSVEMRMKTREGETSSSSLSLSDIRRLPIIQDQHDDEDLVSSNLLTLSRTATDQLERIFGKEQRGQGENDGEEEEDRGENDGEEQRGRGENDGEEEEVRGENDGEEEEVRGENDGEQEEEQEESGSTDETDLEKREKERNNKGIGQVVDDIDQGQEQGEEQRIVVHLLGSSHQVEVQHASTSQFPHFLVPIPIPPSIQSESFSPIPVPPSIPSKSFSPLPIPPSIQSESSSTAERMMTDGSKTNRFTTFPAVLDRTLSLDPLSVVGLPSTTIDVPGPTSSIATSITLNGSASRREDASGSTLGEHTSGSTLREHTSGSTLREHTSGSTSRRGVTSRVLTKGKQKDERTYQIHRVSTHLLERKALYLSDFQSWKTWWESNPFGDLSNQNCHVTFIPDAKKIMSFIIISIRSQNHSELGGSSVGSGNDEHVVRSGKNQDVVRSGKDEEDVVRSGKDEDVVRSEEDERQDDDGSSSRKKDVYCVLDQGDRGVDRERFKRISQYFSIMFSIDLKVIEDPDEASRIRRQVENGGPILE
ncbi:hypothetical protein TREMEDRAFT_66304 [Tremella mesenterica DSM 1558]|uniref:uncharacterized protein n=1 Tax=Tremella mesenterica (strain ATCC 24925 / CBS 8224 / DSM 1558 / NBRC 9311 / NRRL Y-6157 / RJB 2259-6 / UBC 559-6) TaxID=578456 RepID=UPI00032CAD3D|nr:uncharacterized protein TREMEDRAFT_66304 [Tremella mesenterica DSM 1558]EIW65707.1 hypothetical protein TREMEDRAFT_66304 [Tremella mesenterica DSM 1558]